LYLKIDRSKAGAFNNSEAISRLLTQMDAVDPIIAIRGTVEKDFDPVTGKL